MTCGVALMLICWLRPVLYRRPARLRAGGRAPWRLGKPFTSAIL